MINLFIGFLAGFIFTIIALILYSCYVVSGQSNTSEITETKHKEKDNTIFVHNKNNNTTLDDCLFRYYKDGSQSVISDGKVIGFTV